MSTPLKPSVAEAQELGGLAMLQAIARKVAAMQQDAHDNAMRQEGAAAAFAVALKRLDEMDAKAKGLSVRRYAEQAQGLLLNLQQVALNQMGQQSGRSLQASDVLEVCKALASNEKEGVHAAHSRP